MKRRYLLRHLQAHRYRLEREGTKHSLWLNPATRAVEAVPRHAEIGKHLSRKFCRQLSVPEPRGQARAAAVGVGTPKMRCELGTPTAAPAARAGKTPSSLAPLGDVSSRVGP